eukprot:CAMPEP_0174889736 /NCGR_PEP_ID=MMETSP0167-20121228/4942_1 /TAXON_ID=38298 /ORGANISM="Rhodella maculata, Strain CCMP736" /LENGTH=46 /DNA_ID= /DNA_START= /DNA_END= /DNA_ORIENTATION=
MVHSDAPGSRIIAPRAHDGAIPSPPSPSPPAEGALGGSSGAGVGNG